MYRYRNGTGPDKLPGVDGLMSTESIESLELPSGLLEEREQLKEIYGNDPFKSSLIDLSLSLVELNAQQILLIDLDSYGMGRLLPGIRLDDRAERRFTVSSQYATQIMNACMSVLKSEDWCDYGSFGNSPESNSISTAVILLGYLSLVRSRYYEQVRARENIELIGTKLSNYILGVLRDLLPHAGIDIDLYRMREKARHWNKQWAEAHAISN